MPSISVARAAIATSGPFTLLRPVVAVTGGAVGLVRADQVTTQVAVVLGVVAVLAVQPLCDHLWYDAESAPL